MLLFAAFRDNLRRDRLKVGGIVVFYICVKKNKHNTIFIREKKLNSQI